MNLDRVTITGADDSVRPEDLFNLSEEFPYVEWGILVSAHGMGSPRFPSAQWIKELHARAATMQLSIHLCGRWLRSLMMGELDPIILELADARFQRLQLNFHAETLPYRGAFIDAVKRFGSLQVIFQIDGAGGHTFYDFAKSAINAVPLFDVSHGAGGLPAKWPAPLGPYQGYAGGLAPENLAAQLELISQAAGDVRVWVDMETRVRSDNDQIFDLAKVRRCLEIAKPFVRAA